MAYSCKIAVDFEYCFNQQNKGQFMMKGEEKHRSQTKKQKKSKLFDENDASLRSIKRILQLEKAYRICLTQDGGLVPKKINPVNQSKQFRIHQMSRAKNRIKSKLQNYEHLKKPNIFVQEKIKKERMNKFQSVRSHSNGQITIQSHKRGRPSSIISSKGKNDLSFSIQNVRNILLPEDGLLASIFSTIYKDQDKFSLLSSQIIRQIETQYKKSCYSQSQKEELIKCMLAYMRQCAIRMKPELKKSIYHSFFEQFADKILRGQNEAFFNNKNMLRLMSYLAKSKQKQSCYLDLKYDLNLKEAISVAAKTRQLYRFDERAFFFLSNYLYRSCMKLEQSGVSISQVSKTLEAILKEIKEKFPPAPSLSGGKELQITEKYELEKDALKYEMFDFSKVQIDKRKQALEEFILERAKEASESKNKFVDLIEATCRQKGSHFKVGVKIKDKDHKRAIDRVVEKMIDKAFVKYEVEDYQKQKNGEKQGLVDFMVNEQKHYQTQMNQIYGKITEPVPFKVSDMLRAKCLFQTVPQIKDCASKLIKRAKQQTCPLIQIDNRLSKNTSDIVFKILVDKTVTELQLPIQFNIAHNQFNHKVYEVLRSKFYSPIMMLKIINEEIAGDLLSEAAQCFATINKGNSHLQQKALFESDHTFKSLEGQFFKFIEILKFHPKETVPIKEPIYKKYYEDLLLQVQGLVLPEDEKNFIHRNNGEYYERKQNYQKSMIEYNKFLEKLKNKQKNRDNIEQICSLYLRMGLTMWRKGNLSEALKYYQQGLALNPKEDDSDLFNCANFQNNIGLIYLDQGKYELAIEAYNRVLQTIQKVKGKDSFACNSALNNLGLIYQRQHKYDESLQIYLKCLKIIQNTKGKGDIQCAFTLSNIGANFKLQQKYSEALDYYSRCLQIWQKFKGKDSLEVSIALLNIGNVYQQQQKYTEALQYMEHCLEIRQKIQGKHSYDCALPLNNIGAVYNKLKRHQKALEYYNRCLKIKETLRGKKDIDCAMTIENIGIVLVDQKKYSEGIEKYKLARDIFAKVLGQNSKEVIKVEEGIAKARKKMIKA